MMNINWGCLVDIKCVLCNGDDEFLIYLFFSCGFFLVEDFVLVEMEKIDFGLVLGSVLDD